MRAHRESAGKVVDGVVRPLRDPIGPFRNRGGNGDAAAHEDLVLDDRHSVPVAL